MSSNSKWFSRLLCSKWEISPEDRDQFPRVRADLLQHPDLWVLAAYLDRLKFMAQLPVDPTQDNYRDLLVARASRIKTLEEVSQFIDASRNLTI